MARRRTRRFDMVLALTRAGCGFGVRIDQLEFMKLEAGPMILKHHDHGPIRIDQNHGADFTVFCPHQIAGF